MSLAHVLTQFALESHVMTQNLPINPKAGSVYATRSRCLLQWGCLGFRFVRYQCSLWFGLAIAPLELLFASEIERTLVQMRYFRAIARIDFVSVYGLLQDLLW
jgi:hypothetical protein